MPAELADDYQSLFFADETSHEARIVKAADKLSAYVKCLEELAAGNKEFAKACGSIAEELKKYAEMPEVAWFMEHCLSGFSKTLDELG